MKKGRKLEQLVYEMERVLGTSVEIKSPDRLRDVDTGGFREVDISIRGKVGSFDVLVIVECRDRKSQEDVTWIEQLISKRSSVRASKAVAVSSTGFSVPALEKARAHEIETRTFKKIKPKDIRNWFGILASFSRVSYTVIGGEIVIGATNEHEIDGSVAAELWDRESGVPKRSFRLGGSKRMHLLEFFECLRESEPTNLPVLGDHWVEKDFAGDECTVETNRGERTVKMVRIGFAIDHERDELKNQSAHEYLSGEDVLGRRIEISGVVGADKLPVSLVITTVGKMEKVEQS